VGYSFLRSLWYLFAFTGVLAVAFMIPRTPAPMPEVRGSWSLESQAPVAGLPAGYVDILLDDDHYALHYEGVDPLTSAAGFESGITESDGEVLLLKPLWGAYMQPDGTWIRQLPPSRRLRTTMMDGESLILTDADGNSLKGRQN
jgi:hypothetical protein